MINNKNEESYQERIASALKEAAQKLSEQQRRRTEPIAVISLACRYPGGANTPEKFFELLLDGKETTSVVPKDRFDIEQYFNNDSDASSGVYTRHGSFLDDIALFDPVFFGISPREARMMDPQQRILLELSWELFERAGVVPSTLRGSNSSVFIGSMTHDYVDRIEDLADLDPHSASGNISSALAGRLSFYYGIHGPSIVVDTACSSSLVAVHQALQSLRLGETDLAIAGGVNAICSPKFTVAECRAKMLSKQGRCNTFDQAADGYLRSEGAGLVLLKRLSDAERDGDNIIAIIRGSAINHDGRSAGLTVPNGVAQQSVISQALNQAKLSTEQIQYIEAHGTATPLGDPIEINSLAALFENKKDQPLLVGTVKTNFGHLEGAAGIVGLSKVILSLDRQIIPPHLNFNHPSTHIDWQNVPIQILTEAKFFTAEQPFKYGGVSSFGFSGTNAHLILERYEKTASSSRSDSTTQLLTLSAKSQEALIEYVTSYISFLRTCKEQDLARICYTANTRRTLYPHRIAVVADSLASMIRQLQQLVESGFSRSLSYRDTDSDLALPTSSISDPVGNLCTKFLQGEEVDWSVHYSEPLQPLPLPTYPFQRQRYWLDVKSQNVQGTSIVDDYYSALSAADASLEYSESESDKDRFLTFGPIAERIPGFSWSLAQAFPEKYASDISRMIEAQLEMREMLFEKVDFQKTKRILDIGCGYGTDLRRLASANSGVECFGYTIAKGQAEVGNRLATEHELADRVSIFHRDSARDPFPDQLDLIFGFEVVHHVPNKEDLFKNIADHLKVGGMLLLADFIANTQFDIDHDETSSFFIKIKQWAELFARAGLEIVDTIDISPEVANFLHDDNFEENLVLVKKTNSDPNVEAAIRSYHQLGKMFEKGLASYTLFALRKIAQRDQAQLSSWNTSRLENPASYSQRSDKGSTYCVQWRELDISSLRTQQPDIRRTFLVVQDESLYLKITKDAVLPLDKFEVRLFNENLLDELSLIRIENFAVVFIAEQDQSLLVDEPEFNDLKSLLKILQLAQTSSNCLRSVVITSNSQAVSDKEQLLNPRAAALWGMTRAAMEEDTTTAYTLVDIEKFTDLATVLTDLNSFQGQYAFRAGRWLEPVLALKQLNTAQHFVLQESKSYLITGGNGAVGSYLAKWLVKNGARSIVLLSRKVASKELIAEIVGDSQAKVVSYPVDISDFQALKLVKSKIDQDVPGVSAIFHCAGVLDDSAILQLDDKRVQKVFAPKVNGAINLHKLFADTQLDLFLHTGSMTALLGNAGQANYAAANAFLDSFARWQRFQGVPAISINFGALVAEAGMAEEIQLQTRFESRGIAMLPMNKTISAIERIVAENETGLGVIAVNWKKFLARYPLVNSPLIRNFVSTDSVATDKNSSQRILEIISLPIDRRLQALKLFVRESVAAVLELSPNDIGLEQGFFDLGMDSLIAVDLRNRLQNETGVDLPATLTFTYPTVNALAQFLEIQLPQGAVDLSLNEKVETVRPESAKNGAMIWSEIDEELAKLRSYLQ